MPRPGVAAAIAGAVGLGAGLAIGAASFGGGEQAPETVVVQETETVTRFKSGRLRGEQRFTGSGPEVIGSVRLPADSVVRWTCSCSGGFELSSDANADDHDIKVVGGGKGGEATVFAGSYENVRVEADGRWTVSFTPI